MKSVLDYCPNCGSAVLMQSPSSHTTEHAKEHQKVPSLGRRMAVIFYVSAYAALVIFCIGFAQTMNQYFTTPDPQSSYITCKSGVKVPYKLLAIRNPTSDPGHDDLLIDAACRNLGGNTYTNVMRRGPKASIWEYGAAALAGGLIMLELLKGTIVYLIKGYFPGFGTLNRR
jgi:hypothetical protein